MMNLDTLHERMLGLRRKPARMGGGLAFLIILLAIISILPAFFHDSTYIMHILIMSLIWSGVVVGWDLMMGYAGIFTFGQVGIFVVGAYVAEHFHLCA